MTTPAVTFSGIASGFDSSSIISELVAADKAPETDMQSHISDAQTQISTLADIMSKLQSLGTTGDALNTGASIQSLNATSSDSSQVSVTANGTASAGNYSVVVNQLAQAQSSVSSRFASDTAGIAGTGAITIQAGNGTAYTVNYGSADTLDSIASNITMESNGAVSASVLNDGTGYRIVVNATASGAANAVSFSETGSGLGLSGPDATLEAAQDASLTVNGLTVTRPNNSISDVIQGVTFNLLSKTPNASNPVSVGVSYDTSALQTKMQSIVDAYNTVVSALGAQLNYTGTTMGTNTLFGDSGLRALQGDLANVIVQAYPNGSGGTLTSADLGVTLNNDGTLSLDSAKFSQAVSANPNAVQNLLLGTGHNGMVSAIDSLVTNYTQSGTGVLSTETSSRNDLITGYNNQIDQIEAQASSLQDALTTEFASLDTIEATYKSQASYLTQMSNQSSS